MPGLAAVVSAGSDLDGALANWAAAGLPVVAIEVGGLLPGESLSTLGEPGARYDQAGFLAGISAGLATRVGWVGLIEGTAGAEEIVYRAAFVNGLRYICPRCQLVALLPNEVSVDAFRAKGVDVVAALPGPGAEPALATLSDSGFWFVLIGESGASVPTPQVAARVFLEPEAAVIPALEGLLAGEPGTSWPTSLGLGSVRVADLDSDAITPGRERLLRQAIEALIAGSLDVGIDPESGEPR